MDLMHMWEQMGWVAKVIGVILIIMSMISFGVAIERIFTFYQARKQSKLYAPQVAKHLKAKTSLEKVYFVLFDEPAREAFEKVWVTRRKA